MKKLVMAMLLVFAFAVTARAVEIKDVPPSHWAYESIQKLVEKGYIAIYDDDTFRGDQAVSRTVLAAALAKLIDQIESGELKMGGSDMKEVQKLIQEFAGDMADSEARTAALEKRLADIESGETVIQLDISKSTVEFREKYEQMERNVAILEDQLAALDAELKSEVKKRKSITNMLMIGVVAAIAVGAGN